MYMGSPVYTDYMFLSIVSVSITAAIFELSELRTGVRGPDGILVPVRRVRLAPLPSTPPGRQNFFNS